MNGKFTLEKAKTVLRWIKNLHDSLTECERRCEMKGKHQYKKGYPYRTVVFHVRHNGRVAEHTAIEIVKKMENHGLIFHCGHSGLIYITQNLE